MASSGKRVYAALATIFLVVGGAFGYAPRPAVFSVLCASAPPRENNRTVSGSIAETYTNYIDGTLLGVQVAGNGVVPDYNLALPQNISSGQPLGFTLTQGGATRSAAVSYDGSGKILNLTDGAVSANYLWTPGGHATGIVVNVAGAARLSLASAWNEALGVRSNMTFKAGGATVASFAFQRGNGTSQITRIVREDGTSREISYDGSGRLAGWKHKNAAGVADYDRSWVFGYDGANNLVSAGRDPTVAGGPLPMSPMCKQYATQNIRSNSQFSVDAFNFSAVRNWRAVDLVCYAVTNARVTVNGMAARRNGTRFVVSIPLAQNSTASVTNLTVCAVTSAGTNLEYYTTNVVTLTLPAYPETIGTALASAVTSDSVAEYLYDARGQLRRVTDKLGATAIRLQSTYDYYPDGRRARKTVTVWDGSAWQPYRTCQYIYDRWNMVREIVAANGTTTTRDYTWGLDLQGFSDGQWRQNAGGIGGLLAITEVSGGKTNIFLPVCDHIGTVQALVAAVTNNVTLSTPAIVANFDYSPYGELIAQDGPYAGSCAFSYSSKFRDQETGLLYYGERFFNPKTGSWLTSDPAGEAGGLNLTEFVGGDPVNNIDAHGEATWEVSPSEMPSGPAAYYASDDMIGQLGVGFLNFGGLLINGTYQGIDKSLQGVEIVGNGVNKVISENAQLALVQITQDMGPDPLAFAPGSVALGMSALRTTGKYLGRSATLVRGALRADDFAAAWRATRPLGATTGAVRIGPTVATETLLPNAEVRAWYNIQVRVLDTSGALTRDTAARVHAARNALKLQARRMMVDRAAAEQLAREQPLQSLEYYIEKYSKEDYRGEALWKRIIEGGITPNEGVNKMFGVE